MAIIRQVYIWANGNALAADVDGSPVPGCCGFILDMARLIRERSDRETEFWFMGHWPHDSAVRCSFSCWFGEE